MKKLFIPVLLIAFCMLSACSETEFDNQTQLIRQSPSPITVFLDAGHGKPSGEMTAEEKEEYGWIKNSKDSYGEWRHWRDGKYGTDCCGDDGEMRQKGDCWYPIVNGDRGIEPDINLQNCLYAQEYLEQMGYNVVLSRKTNEENPSITKRIADAADADAALYICVHSNAGGGRGTSYISMSEEDGFYAANDVSLAVQSNILGKTINDKIAENTSLSIHGNGCIDFEPFLILFHKSPIPCAYLEIGFFDNTDDLAILQNEHDKIGKSIAEGIDEYCNEYMN